MKAHWLFREKLSCSQMTETFVWKHTVAMFLRLAWRPSSKWPNFEVGYNFGFCRRIPVIWLEIGCICAVNEESYKGLMTALAKDSEITYLGWGSSNIRSMVTIVSDAREYRSMQQFRFKNICITYCCSRQVSLQAAANSNHLEIEVDQCLNFLRGRG